jgi:hypothetical protein
MLGGKACWMMELSPSATPKSSVPMLDNSRLQWGVTWQAGIGLQAEKWRHFWIAGCDLEDY